MKTVNSWWVLFLCICFFCPSADAQEVKTAVLNWGYCGLGITEIDPKDTCAALRIWAQEIGDAYKCQVNITPYDSMVELAKDFANKKLDVVTMQSIDALLNLPAEMNVNPGLARSRNGKTSIKYLLLVNADGEIKRLANLKNKRLAIKQYNHLGKMFLDVELMKSNLPKADRFFAGIQENPKESQVVLEVFFGQADACITTDACFATVVELNPQMGRKLKVMASSTELVETISFFSKNYPPHSKGKAIEAFTKGTKGSKRFRQLSILFSMEGMATVTDDQLDTVRALLVNYNRLVGAK